MKGLGRVVKQVGASGHISLGKEFAGRTVLIDSTEPGVWVIKTAQTIAHSELWLHQPTGLLLVVPLAGFNQVLPGFRHKSHRP